MVRQIVHQMRRRRVTLAGAAAIASLAFGTWAVIPTAYSTSDVENIELLDQPRQGSIFRGVFDGSIVEGGQSGTAAQVKVVRNGHSVQGSYLLGETAGALAAK